MGKGERERERARFTQKNRPNRINLVDKINKLLDRIQYEAEKGMRGRGIEDVCLCAYVQSISFEGMMVMGDDAIEDICIWSFCESKSLLTNIKSFFL